MSRSQKKGPFVDEKLFRKVQKAEEAGSREPIKTWARSCTVIPEFIGYTFLIHDGRKHVKVQMTEDMVGHISLANLLRRVPLKVTAAARRGSIRTLACLSTARIGGILSPLGGNNV